MDRGKYLVSSPKASSNKGKWKAHIKEGTFKALLSKIAEPNYGKSSTSNAKLAATGEEI